MEVILLEKIKNLGSLGDRVSVKAGFGRNFLIPQGKAVSATPGNVERFEAMRADLEKAQADALAVATERAAKLGEVFLFINARTSAEGKLFGSIGPGDIAEALTAAGQVVDKREVRMPGGPLREVGEHEVEIHLHPELNASVTVRVAPEGTTLEMIQRAEAEAEEELAAEAEGDEGPEQDETEAY